MIEAMIPKARATSGNIITPTIPAEKPSPARSAARASEAPEDHGADVLGGRGLEQVGAAAGAVADVVAHQVGDHGRVARVVLGDARLHLAHQVGADVGRLGVDPAAQLGEQGHEGGAEAVADDEQGDVPRLLHAAEGVHQRVEAGDAEQAHGHHQQAGDRPAPQGDAEGPVDARQGGVGGAGVAADGDPHPDVAGEHRAGGAEDERDGDPHRQFERGVHRVELPVVPQHSVADEDQPGDDDRQHHDRAVLAAQERLGALADGVGDLLHRLAAAVVPQHPSGQQGGDDQA